MGNLKQSDKVHIAASVIMYWQTLLQKADCKLITCIIHELCKRI